MSEKSIRASRMIKALLISGTIVLTGFSAITIFNTCSGLIFNGVDPTPPCYSAEEAKQKGLLVATVSLTPNELLWKGQTIEFKEAWLEKAGELQYYILWYPHYEWRGEYNFCFTLKRGHEAFDSPDHPMFLLEDIQGHSITSIRSKGRVPLFYEKLGAETLQDKKIYCVANFKEERKVFTTIKLNESR